MLDADWWLRRSSVVFAVNCVCGEQIGVGGGFPSKTVDVFLLIFMKTEQQICIETTAELSHLNKENYE